MTPQPVVPAPPPVAPVREHVRSDHGVPRRDEYAWMLDRSDPELLAYLEAERAYYDQQTAHLAPLVQTLTREMTARVPAADESVHWTRHGVEYFTRTPEGRDFAQLCRVGGHGDAEVLLDENVLAEEAGSAFVELGLRLVSPDGRLLAYSVDTDGEEVYELRFRDLVSGRDLADTVAHTYYTGAWSSDSTVFFYTVNDHLYRPHQVWRHTLGTDASADVLVLQEDDQRFEVVVHASRSGELVVIRSADRDTSEVWIVPAAHPEQPARVVEPRRPGVEYDVSHVPGRDGGDLLVVTDDGAPEFRLVRAPVATPGRDHWVEVVAGHPTERLVSADVFRGHVVLQLVSHARQILRLLPLSVLGAPDADLAAVDVEASVPAGSIALRHDEDFATDAVLVAEESYTEPRTWYRVSLATGDRELVRRDPAPGYDPSRYRSERLWVDAPDGTRIPVTVAHRRDVALDGRAPVLLYGYGAYESSDWPSYDPGLASLLDRGVVFAHAHVRGGGEMGRWWWQQGRLLAKRNTFDDFVAVADGLATRGVVDGSRIVSRGLSAGGLLQGAVYSLRPDRWRAVVAEVPFVDCVNSMLDPEIPLTVNEWDEWGDPRIREVFDYMLGYTPYENVPAARERPDLLVTGALHDPRVLVHEPAKWTARLRATDDGSAGRVLFRAVTGVGGHTGPPGRLSHLGYEAEVYAFVLDALAAAEERPAAG